jgi:hypothetical protein
VSNTRDQFVSACTEAFVRLAREFQYDGPEVEPIGREVFVRYHSGYRTVSISYEPGMSPIAELFYPAAETGEQPLEWAQRNGVPRARRIPRLRVGPKFEEAEPDTYGPHLAALADGLCRQELDFITGKPLGRLTSA